MVRSYLEILDETLNILVHQIIMRAGLTLSSLVGVAGTHKNRTEMMIFTPVVVIQTEKTFDELQLFTGFVVREAQIQPALRK